MTRVIVCGGRDVRDEAFVHRELDRLHVELGFTLIIEGGDRQEERRQGRRVTVGGADYFASTWAMRRGVETVCERAQWAVHGRGAGPIRNKAMVDNWKPTHCVAFDTGGPGTADMTDRARRSGLLVTVIEARHAR